MQHWELSAAVASEKTRHIDTQERWLQDAKRNPELEVQKVASEENVADILTKNVKSEVPEKRMADMEFINVTRREMDDELTGAHEQISSQTASVAKKTSAESGVCVVKRKW